jgi:primosomal protein N' (replication factor Y) (superfamily II helicase)
MIAQIVFDLPLDGPFDYLIPEHLIPQITVGSRVKVSFGPKAQIGFVTGLLSQSTFSTLKSIQSLSAASAAFNSLDLTFAREFCAYYGCSLGEALGTILRNKEDHGPSIRREHKPQYSLYRCRPDQYAFKIREIINGYRQSKSSVNFLILVPDTFRAETLSQQLKGVEHIKIGARSLVFESDGRHDCIIMVDEEDASYKQEQMPMYETRQVLWERSHMYGFDIAFIGITPSVELMALAREDQIKWIESPTSPVPSAKLVDLSNYKFIPGLISPPVRDALDAALKASKKSVLILNRRGSYRLTRCVDCAEVLKCSHCDSPLIYSRKEGKYLCRHCTYTAPGDTVCPRCHKPSWKSVGIGVEQVQTELKKLFPSSRVVASEAKQSFISDFDILISTQAVLRFQGRWQASVAAFIDFDAELNRLDMRSAFDAFSLALHISSMAIDAVFIQTRNNSHYVLQSLSRGNIKYFYDEELKLRKEFGFTPFKHWVKISWRGKSEKSTKEAAAQVYNELSKSAPENYTITPPLADAVGRKRDQYRFNVMVQADHVSHAVAFIKSTITKLKRPSRVIVTFNIDP